MAFASIMISETKKIKAISEFLGHYSMSITLDKYVHAELDLKDLDVLKK